METAAACAVALPEGVVARMPMRKVALLPQVLLPIIVGTLASVVRELETADGQTHAACHSLQRCRLRVWVSGHAFLAVRTERIGTPAQLSTEAAATERVAGDRPGGGAAHVRGQPFRAGAGRAPQPRIPGGEETPRAGPRAHPALRRPAGGWARPCSARAWSALQRPFVHASLGGVHNEAEMRGHHRTYVGALPGRIVQALRQAGARDWVMTLDEGDRMSANLQGAPSAARPEVADPEQNAGRCDNNLGVPFDLNSVVFIATAHLMDTVSAPERDRIEMVELPGQAQEEKLQANRLREAQWRIGDAAMRASLGPVLMPARKRKDPHDVPEPTRAASRFEWPRTHQDAMHAGFGRGRASQPRPHFDLQ